MRRRPIRGSRTDKRGSNGWFTLRSLVNCIIWWVERRDHGVVFKSLLEEVPLVS